MKEDRGPAYGWRNPWLLLAMLVLGLAGWQWLETRVKLADTQQELARRLAESDSANAESRALARQAQEELAVVQGRLGAFAARLAESQSQRAMIEQLYQELAGGAALGALAREARWSAACAGTRVARTGPSLSVAAAVGKGRDLS